MDCLNCVEAAARLHLYIDRELSDEEVTIIQQHIMGCSHCGGRFQFNLRLKRLIHERCTIEHAPPHLREAVVRLAQLPPGQRVDIDPELLMEIKADLEDPG